MIPLQQFCDVHEVSINNVYVQKSTGKLNKNLFRRVGKKDLLVDNKAFVRRKIFQDKIIQENQDLFYHLTESMSQRQMALLISDRYDVPYSGLYIAISRDLFKLKIQDPILSYKTSKNNWIINKYYRYLLRQERKKNKNFTF